MNYNALGDWQPTTQGITRMPDPHQSFDGRLLASFNADAAALAIESVDLELNLKMLAMPPAR